jgi:hypothetical protein
MWLDVAKKTGKTTTNRPKGQGATMVEFMHKIKARLYKNNQNSQN